MASTDYDIVIPVHNEAPNVQKLVEEIVTATRENPPQKIIFVDDGSTDGTAREIAMARSNHPGMVSHIRNLRRSGQSTALYNGVLAAQGEWIVTLDGDGQNDPVDIPAVLARLRESVDPRILVIGHRVHRADTWIRRRASRIANAVRGRMLDDRSPDTGCGLKGFRREVFLSLPYFDHMHRFMPALIRQVGGEVASIPVHHRPRTAGQSKYGILDRLWVGIVDLFGVAWLARRNRRTEWTREVT
jgi:dolichol-phosphate mannosyltransferase